VTNLLILGASTRAAAFSARRAGLRPWCVDLFADADLQRRFPVRRLAMDAYPHGILAALHEAPAGPILYTGGLENYPDLLARIDRPIWGTPPDVLRRVRSPFTLAEVLRQSGLPTLVVRSEPPSSGDSRRWLLKPLRGSGGVGIRRYQRGARLDRRTHYLQEWSGGDCHSAVFLGLADRRAILVGVSKLIRPAWTHAPAFHYAGSVVTHSFNRTGVEGIGACVARTFGVIGLFGVDFAVHVNPAIGRAQPVVLEVNPRYTASAEIHERAHDRPLLDLHRAVFEGRPVHVDPPGSQTVLGKAILYARARLVFPADGPWSQALTRDDLDAEYADIPHPGEVIPRGRPVMTLIASGATEAECLDALRQKTEALDRYLWG
jgi:predicted ATP-grasp superfamily ATP-dependent carboligase